MGTDINLYKINDIDEFEQKIKEEYVEYPEMKDNHLNNLVGIDFILYLFSKPIESKIKWSWVIDSFDAKVDSYLAKPKAILVIKKENNYYTVSFGYAYAFVSRYADKNWPLEFAERMDYLSVKSVGILAPNSLINRKIYNYFNYDFLDVDSGEALNSIAVRLDLDDEVSEFLSEYAIIGNSIKFRIKTDNLLAILNLVNFVEGVMNNDPKRQIPQFKKIDNKKIIKSLNEKLTEIIREDILTEKEYYSINISEFTVDGSQYVFFNNDFDNFGFHLEDKQEISEVLSVESIYDFIKNNDLVNSENLLDLNITLSLNDEIREKQFKNLLMYVGDKNICIDGDWYQYNKLLVDAVHNTLSDIRVCYDEDHDFLTMDEFHSARDSLKKELNVDKDWYFEYFFNRRMEHLYERYECLDRKTTQVKYHKIEEADL